MDFTEWLRRLKRSTDSYLSYRKLFFLILLGCLLLLYLAPYFMQRFTVRQTEDFAETCLKDRLTSFSLDLEEFNANLLHDSPREGEKNYVSWIGNGVFGMETKPDSNIYIRNGRTLSLSVPCQPLATVSTDDGEPWQEANVLHYFNGIAHKLQCRSSGLHVAYQFYAHRTFPAILVQDIKVTNPDDSSTEVNIIQNGLSKWPGSNSSTIILQMNNKRSIKFLVVSGMVSIPLSPTDQVVAVALVMQVVPKAFSVKQHSTSGIQLLTSINYSEPIDRSDYLSQRSIAENQAIESMKQTLRHHNRLRDSHVSVWHQLWSTGISISYSKASDSINGDQINATMYYVLSHVRSSIHEHISFQQKAELEKILLYSEGCFGGHHTLQAQNLWSSLSSVSEINIAVSLWLLTLEKQGCHKLLRAGASGVVEAMVLSFGGLRFSNQHLEFNIHPKYLHRDFHFRRVGYGNSTHVNISVVLQDDNKAVLHVSLDRSDKYYYACDAGCLDTPVQLGPSKRVFPVKLTDPVTAILYITYDKQHMEELRHTIHVKEIAEAPAHEHHVIALHKHGHHLGGLPTLFWVSISFLIIIFHLFLIKLIYNEYCGSQDKYRTRYSKL